MKKGIKFVASIHFKIALVFTLTLLVTLELIGAFFIKQLERSNLSNFRQQITLPAYVSDQLTQQLTGSETASSNANIHNVLSSVNNVLITEIEVVDTQGIIRGTSDINDQDAVGQKTTDSNLRHAANNQTYLKNPVEQHGSSRYQTVVKPLIETTNGDNTTVGAVIVKANLESVYATLQRISVIYLSATLLAVMLGVIMAVIISRALAKPISDINQRTIRIAAGDYSGDIDVRSHDEIGQLATNVNALAQRIEETTNSQELERRRLDSVLEHMTDGVIATDRRGSINLINSAALAMIGIEDVSEVLGQYVLQILHLNEQYQLREFFENDDNLFLDFSDDDRQLKVKVYNTQIQRESGFISGMVIVLHDVTEEQRINEERRQFVSNVSHELRTPLTSVKSYIDALQDGAMNDQEVAPHFLKVAQDETTRMIHMINDLLELSRMDSGTMRLTLEYVNLSELFNYILNRFDMIISNEQQPDQKQYSIVRDVTDESIWVEIDPSKLTQVIDNIMNNAIKYSPDGGVITTRMVKEERQVVLSISDQGLGIPQKDLNHVFDRFFRVDKARSRAQGGTGLGLAISKEIVESFKGKIWVTSQEGQGSTFNIALPYTIEGNLDDDWEDDDFDEMG
ncbi:cell wall metabolism sensor histidine kinase WalK [Weissella diestrammenae]|uniref:histidine kinase n=1 Tax=Weissella diestrammenae TaxID=1162633 RepID=A0A7G9T6N1_9LACO|nr:cell wall metabolism sensor histidine kinase WalK [Weissella diestrammenae]MCM0582959.1 cell wall metabolism sensor histidine kinase WalK [Weissella diestrammenae]QNN75756.1 cell wall metabolism sensor histidine kinase WalK [Weissella diestrammenae]